MLELRPGITNPGLWGPDRPPRHIWKKIRLKVLERDNWSCAYCGHVAKKFMNVHHKDDSGSVEIDRLVTSCVACHAILHAGRTLGLGKIEIWESPTPQVEIVRKTREGIKAGRTLDEIREDFSLSRGPHPPDSVDYVNELIRKMGDAPRAYLDEPLMAVFVDFQRWQI